MGTNLRTMLIKALGLTDASPEKQDEVIESMGALVYQAVITRALEEMDEATVDEFEKITDGEPTPDTLIAFFMKRIPNFEQMMQEESAKIVADSVNMMSKLN